MVEQSYVNSIWPVVGCLTQLEDSLHKRFTWYPSNEKMATAVGLIGCAAVREMLGDGSLVSIASESYETINTFLREHGCLGELQPFAPRTFNPDQYRVATASRLLMRANWDASVSRIRSDGIAYDAFTVSGRIHTPMYNLGPKAWIEIDGGDGLSVVITMPGLEDLCPGNHGSRGTEVQVTVPCVSLKCSNDLSWAVGEKGNWVGFIKTLSGDVFGSNGLNDVTVEQAVQTSGLDLDETGATATSVAAMRFCLGTGYCPPQILYVTIDKPFNFKLSKSGYEAPIMTGFLAEDVWRKA